MQGASPLRRARHHQRARANSSAGPRLGSIEILSCEETSFDPGKALDDIGATDCGIFRPQLVFDKENRRATYGPNLDPKWREATRQQRQAVPSLQNQLVFTCFDMF